MPNGWIPPRQPWKGERSVPFDGFAPSQRRISLRTLYLLQEGPGARSRDFFSPEDHHVYLDLIPAAMFSPLLVDAPKKLELDSVDVTESGIYHTSGFLGAMVELGHGIEPSSDIMMVRRSSLVNYTRIVSNKTGGVPRKP
ncbi:hypothetical protein AB1N83_004057 [Pleurotus pulmonarius]